MSRKREVALILIGMVAHIVLYLSDFSYNIIDANYPDRANEFGRGMNIVLIVFSVTIIGILAGAVSALLFRKNKRPKAASTILLMFGLITTILTYGGSFIANIFYFIAGVMGIVRKSKTHKV